MYLYYVIVDIKQSSMDMIATGRVATIMAVWFSTIKLQLREMLLSTFGQSPMEFHRY